MCKQNLSSLVGMEHSRPLKFTLGMAFCVESDVQDKICKILHLEFNIKKNTHLNIYEQYV